MSSANDPLLQPFKLKHLELRNRLVSTSHEPAYSENGMPKERYRLYQEEKARGGIGLTMFGGSSNVSPDSPAVFGNLDAGTDEIIPWFRELADAVHGHGAAIMCQITHMGRRTVWNSGNWLPTVAPSRVREPAHRSFPKVLEEWDIRRIVRDYAEGARRCRDGGLDGVEIESYGHLLDGFWSPITNQRSDKYGGSLDNRLRFAFEVLEAIRAAVGDDFIVGIRMVGDEMKPGGLDPDEGVVIAKRLEATGTLDFINVIRGYIGTDEGISHVIPGMGTPMAPHLEYAGRIREAVGLPVMHAARINDVATARHALRDGLVDLVGMTRAHMADPHIALKVEHGEEERIRPCVGAGYCIDRLYEAGEALCLHNPATGREATIPHVIPRSNLPGRKVVVVGAGPAGLEAARVSALRGHDVVLFEATDRPGGQLVIASKLERRRELIGITDWLHNELLIAGAEVRFNTYAEMDTVEAEDPDIVIIATGGVPDTDIAPGCEQALSTWDVLSGQAKPDGDVLIFDDHGNHEGMSCAEYLIGKCRSIEIVTPDRMAAHEIGGTNYPAYYRAFIEAGVTVTPNQRLVKVEKNGGRAVVRFENDFTGGEIVRQVDHLVIEQGTVPADEVYLEMREASINQGEVDIKALLKGRPQTIINNREGKYRLYRVGDAVSCRNVHAAIYDSIRLCKDF